MGLLLAGFLLLAALASHPEFHSKALHKFEPLSRYELLFEGQVDYDRVNLYGHKQPYPDKLSINFEAFNQKFSYDFFISHELYQPTARVLIYRGDDFTTEVPTVTSYRFQKDENEWGSLTVKEDGRIHAVLYKNNEMYQIDPISEHEAEIHHETLATLKEHATHGMIIFRHSDLKHDGDNLHLCGVADKHNPTAQIQAEPRRKLLQIVRWTNCYPNDGVARRMHVGWAADLGYYQAYGSSTSTVQSANAQIFSDANSVYLAQLNVFLTMGTQVIQTTTNSIAWNKNRLPTSNCLTIGDDLNAFSAWRQSAQPTLEGIWHLFTDCFPPPGTVGLAWVGTLCSIYHGTGVSTKSSTTWLTTAHEIGHNFGASHTFQLGQGTTGGIMDYGNGKLNGIYQFHTTYSKTEMCTEITSSFTATGSGNVAQTQCWTTFNPICGNGIIEGTEACDDGGTSGCCTSTCALIAGGQCTNGPCCLNCKFAMANLTCNNGAGYCSAGKCLNAVCNGYTGLSYCGTRPGNACKQRCLYNGACNNMTSFTVSGGAPFPVNVVAGTVCGVNSVCDANGNCVQQTVAPLLTPTWQTGTWGLCSVNCGTGSQTRQVVCKDPDGSTVDDSTCLATGAARPNDTQTCVTGVTCTLYNWSTTAWVACNASCDGGYQSRTVQCVNNAQSPAPVVPDASCTASTQPAAAQTCNSVACVRSWVLGGFSACNAPCGNGTQTRAVTCVKTLNNVQLIVANSECPAGVPASSQPCNPQPCATFEWFSTGSSCSQACGGGTQTNTIVCRVSQNQTIVPDGNCQIGTRPATTTICNTDPCPVYLWSTGVWGNCSLTCGTGSQVRTVACINNLTQQAVMDSFCTISRPASTTSCNTQLCSDFHWMLGQWSACSQQCGGGTMSRSVICHDMALGDNAPPVNETKCAGQVKPTNTSVCNQQACASYAWFIGDWGSCSKSCGTGSQNRTVGCVLSGTTSVYADSLCAGTKPATSQSCNSIACSNPVWAAGNWSTCTKACGSGTRSRTVSCVQGSTGASLALTSCANSGTAPTTNETCNTNACPTVWYTGQWSTCSKVCEYGTQNRSVDCRQADNLSVVWPDSSCSGSKPSESTTCNAFPCPAWQAGPWSNCSARCDDGNQTRTVTCISFQGLVVDPSQCVHSMPATSQVCNVAPCPLWLADAWSDCSKACGGGTQTRNLSCHLPHDAPYYGAPAPDPTLCPTTLPPAVQICNIQACPSFYWSIASWSGCSQSCGGGTQTGSYVCYSAATSAQVAASNCGTAPAASTRACGTSVCPVYQWFISSNWSVCNAACAGGAQTRSVYCRDTSRTPPPNSTATLDTPVDVANDSFCTPTGARPPTVQVCNIGTNLCQNGGICNITNKRCSCIAGWYGFNCQYKSAVGLVSLDAAAYTQGVPVGETLNVAWNTEGDIDKVSILLGRSSWDFPSYIATGVPNNVTMARDRVFQWHIPTNTEYGDDYFITVHYSPNTYSSSTPFTIADPCLYISCGQFGQCISGTGECECVAGYSGLDCSVSPCDSAGCNLAASTCDPLTGECICTNDFTGTQCYNPPGCPFDCLNNGTVTGLIDMSQTPDEICAALTCQCVGLFTGPDCGNCTLQCSNGGTPQDNCRLCDCPYGFFGRRCQCKYNTVKVRMNYNGTTWVSEPSSMAQFGDLFSTDVSVATLLDSDRVEVESVVPVSTTAIDVLFRFKQVCIDSNLDIQWSGGGRALLQAPGTEDDTQDLFFAFRSQVNDPTAPIYKGVVTSKIDASVAPECVTCGNTPTSGGSKASDNTRTIIIAVVAGVVGLGAIIGISVFCYKKGSQKNREKYQRPIQSSQAVSMASIPASPAPIAVVTGGGAPNVPAGWTAEKTEDGHYFYYNSKTGESQWDVPTAPA